MEKAKQVINNRPNKEFFTNIRSTMCCCCSYQTGTKVLGILALIGGISQLVYDIRLLNFGYSTDVTGAIIVDLVILSLYLLADILLLVAAFKNSSPKLLLPWLVAVILSSTTTLIIYLVVGIPEVGNGGVALIVIGVIGFLIALYFWFVVFKYYKELKNQTQVRNNLPHSNPTF